MTLPLTPKQVTEISQIYGVSRLDVEGAQPVSGGFSGAGVWKLRLNGRNFALRRWPRQGISLNRILGLHHLLEWWTSQGISSLALPLRSRFSHTVENFDGQLWQLENWQPGHADFHQNPSQIRLQNLMHWLARLHKTTPAYSPPESAALWFKPGSSGTPPAIDERLSLLQVWTPAHFTAVTEQIPSTETGQLVQRMLTLAPPLLPRIAWELKLGSTLRVPLFPTARDLWHDHLLFTEDELTGVIDLSATRTECVSADLARILESLFPLDKPRWDAALSLYEQIRSLSPHERQLIEIYNRSQILLSALYWGERISRESFDPEMSQRICTRLQSILCSLENLSRTHS